MCMLWRPLIRASSALLILQMLGTFLSRVLLPDVCFVRVPWAPTLAGQYIVKKHVFISAAIVIGGTVGARQQLIERRRGRAHAEPFPLPASALDGAAPATRQCDA